MNLPEAFTARMQVLLGEEFPAFLHSYEEPRKYGLRVNTLKITPEEFRRIAPFRLRPIPWTDNGFYYEEEDRPSRHPFYYAGLYYLQEPSAMAPAQILPVVPGERVLDLCAAPGGKSTELAAKLQGKGFLAANDISSSRAKGLLKNLEISGVTNSLVTVASPEELAEQFPETFDKILVDAPCSGEGMFRKEEALIRAWSPEKVKKCAEMQKDIVRQSLKMLRPGGMLLYSTCTFSPEEDEQVVADLLRTCPEIELLPVPMCEGFESGNPNLADGLPALKNCVRIYPHKAAGEGHFFALLKKHGKDADIVGTAKWKGSGTRAVSDAGEKKTADAFFEELLTEETLCCVGKNIEIHNSQAYFVPEDAKVDAGVHFLRSGLYLGEIRSGRFIPSQALAMALKSGDCRKILNLEIGPENPGEMDRALRYLRGETIESGGENGWRLVCVDGYPLGWGKVVSGKLKNKYHPGWRMQ